MANIRKMPKVELHRHLEGAIRLDTIRSEARRHALKFPFDNPAEMRRLLMTTEPVSDLGAMMQVFGNLQALFVAPEILERIAFEAVEDAWNDGIRVLELRYSPSYMTEGHQLTFEDAFDAIDRGISKARQKYDLGVTLISIVSRAADADAASQVLQHISKHHDKISGIDLAEKESGFDFSSCREIFTSAKRAGLKVTVHAGEERGLAENVKTAIEVLGADRIGHGIQIIANNEVLELVKERGIPLEVCPTSNFITRNVDALQSHPVYELHKRGILTTINSDDPGMIGIDLTNEFTVCHEILGVPLATLQEMTQTALKASFLNSDEKSYYERSYFSH